MANKPDYKAILTQLYQRYNPEKVRDVDFLLKKFEGREAEMIDKIQRKYAALEPFTSPVDADVGGEDGDSNSGGKKSTGTQIKATIGSEDANSPRASKKSLPGGKNSQSEGGNETPATQEGPSKPKVKNKKRTEAPPNTASTEVTLPPRAKTPVEKAPSDKAPSEKTPSEKRTKTSPQPSTQARKSARRTLGFSLIGLLIGAGAFATWYFWGGSSPVGKKQFLYVVADTVYSHNLCDLGLESRLTPFPYGAGIEVTGLEESCITTRVDGKLEYVPKKYLGSKREFQEIDGVYGNPESRDLFDNSYEKRALRNYFNRTQIMGDIPHKMQIELYGQPRDREVWQVYGMGSQAAKEGEVMEAVAKGKFSWGNMTEVDGEVNRPDDLAVIISEKENRDRRKLLLFNFDEDKVDNFVDEMDLSNYPGFLIRPIQYKEEIFLFGTPYLTLDAERKDEDEEINLALLMQKPGIDDHRYLIEVVQGELQLFSLDKGLFKMYKKDRIYQP